MLVTFGDIAQAIGTQFDPYLTVVVQVLQQASQVSLAEDVDVDTINYVESLREGIVDAWSGILLAYKDKPQGQFIVQDSTPALLVLGVSDVSIVVQLRPHVESIFQLLHSIYEDPHRGEGLSRSSLGVIGDLADAFPNGEFAEYFRADWITQFIREVRSERQLSERTINTARWAREQVKRQISMATAAAMS